MAIVFSDDLQPGMVLASDLKQGGRLLLPQGVELQEVHLKTLKAWGINEVDIVIPEQGGADEGAAAKELPVVITEDLMQEARSFLTPFFALTDTAHPAMAELLRIVSLRTAQKRARGTALPDLPWPDSSATPTSAQDLDDIFKRVPKNAETLMRSKFELASLPDVYTQIVEVMNSPRSSAEHLAEMVSKDSSLTSRLLRLVNSVYYALPSRVDSISRAVTLIGTNELTSMALGITLVNAFKDIPEGYVSMEGFWRHSIACGIFARLLAANKVGISDEQMFVGGLLHDIGRMIMLKQLPQGYSEVVRQARLQRQTLCNVERQLLTYDHLDVGMLLCREWNFSKALEEMIGCHHYPSRGRYAHGCNIIHLADIMAKIYFIGDGRCGCVMISPLQERVWDALSLNPQILTRIFQQADRQINEVIELFLGED